MKVLDDLDDFSFPGMGGARSGWGEAWGCEHRLFYERPAARKGETQDRGFRGGRKLREMLRALVELADAPGSHRGGKVSEVEFSLPHSWAMQLSERWGESG